MLSEDLVPGAGTVAGVAGDIRHELRQAVAATLDCADAWTSGLFRVGRKLTERIDLLAAEAIGAAERAAGATVGTLRDTGDTPSSALSKTPRALVTG